jgi:hypothetical protein
MLSKIHQAAHVVTEGMLRFRAAITVFVVALMLINSFVFAVSPAAAAPLGDPQPPAEVFTTSEVGDPKADGEAVAVVAEIPGKPGVVVFGAAMKQRYLRLHAPDRSQFVSTDRFSGKAVWNGREFPFDFPAENADFRKIAEIDGLNIGDSVQFIIYFNGQLIKDESIIVPELAPVFLTFDRESCIVDFFNDPNLIADDPNTGEVYYNEFRGEKSGHFSLYDNLKDGDLRVRAFKKYDESTGEFSGLRGELNVKQVKACKPKTQQPVLTGDFTCTSAQAIMTNAPTGIEGVAATATISGTTVAMSASRDGNTVTWSGNPELNNKGVATNYTFNFQVGDFVAEPKTKTLACGTPDTVNPALSSEFTCNTASAIMTNAPTGIEGVAATATISGTTVAMSASRDSNTVTWSGNPELNNKGVATNYTFNFQVGDFVAEPETKTLACGTPDTDESFAVGSVGCTADGKNIAIAVISSYTDKQFNNKPLAITLSTPAGSVTVELPSVSRDENADTNYWGGTSPYAGEGNYSLSGNIGTTPIVAQPESLKCGGTGKPEPKKQPGLDHQERSDCSGVVATRVSDTWNDLLLKRLILNRDPRYVVTPEHKYGETTPWITATQDMAITAFSAPRKDTGGIEFARAGEEQWFDMTDKSKVKYYPGVVLAEAEGTWVNSSGVIEFKRWQWLLEPKPGNCWTDTTITVKLPPVTVCVQGPNGPETVTYEDGRIPEGTIVLESCEKKQDVPYICVRLNGTDQIVRLDQLPEGIELGANSCGAEERPRHLPPTGSNGSAEAPMLLLLAAFLLLAAGFAMSRRAVV